MKTNMDDEAPMINKYGDFIYSKKYKLLHSLDKTNLKKQKKVQIKSTSNPTEKLQQVEKIL